MSAIELTPIDIRAYRDPPHVEASIGPVALRHRSDILDRVLPEVSSRPLVYETTIRCCYFDDAARAEAMQRLGDILAEFGRLNSAMCSCSFVAGEG